MLLVCFPPHKGRIKISLTLVYRWLCTLCKSFWCSVLYASMNINYVMIVSGCTFNSGILRHHSGSKLISTTETLC